jgi:hypothetical protein
MTTNLAPRCGELTHSKRVCTRRAGHPGIHSSYTRTPERAASEARYKAANRDKINERKRFKRAADPERSRQEARDYYARDPEKIIKQSKALLYSTPVEQIEKLHEEQGGMCPVCHEEVALEWGGRKFAVDHDHACCRGKKSCGKCVRGVLHIDCNKTLGFLEKFEAAGQAQILGPLRDYVWSRRAAR